MFVTLQREKNYAAFMNITRISFLLSLVLSAISAGATVICGTVSDAESNEELIGASVKIDGTSIGAVTDIDGRYSINVKPGTYSITASYVGFSGSSLNHGAFVKIERIEC